MGDLMHVLRRLRGAMSILAFVVVIAMVGAVAVAGIPDEDGTIHACYNQAGFLRVIDPDTHTCIPNETEITWNRTGPEGPEGPEGPAGAPNLHLAGGMFGAGLTVEGPDNEATFNFGGLIMDLACTEAGLILLVDTDVPGGPAFQFVGANDGEFLHIEEGSLAIGAEVPIPVGLGATTGTLVFGVGTTSPPGAGKQVVVTFEAWGNGQAFAQPCVLQGVAMTEPESDE